jgi:dihydrofolate synthase/folylpolyglutamate synthase
MSRADYFAAVKQLESRGIMPDRIPTLEPIKNALKDLNPEQWLKNPFKDSSKVIIVAGTNGKGSTAATLAHLLKMQGFRVGLYTSPHLQQTTERIRINDQPISEELFVQLFNSLSGSKFSSLSHFEMLTAMACLCFFSGVHCEPMDWVVLEVGLGGTWDATNAIPHSHCVLTPIDFDHQNILGNTLLEIASNKFGVVCKSANVYHVNFPAELTQLKQEVENRTQSNWRAILDFELEVETSETQTHYFLKCENLRSQIRLPGLRGAQNSALALTAFQGLGFSLEQGMKSLSTVSWPGRMEQLQISKSRFGCHESVRVFVSGDHNPHGVASLVELLNDYKWNRLHIICGIGKEKSADQMLEKLASVPKSFLYLTTTPFKGQNIESYSEHWRATAKDAHNEPQTLISKVLLQAEPHDIVLITGSLYLVGLAKDFLNESIQFLNDAGAST